ncbi:Uncharacterised protein [Klebsiella quasivariicola]|nr:Uncharacterised protein [Klebsiella quasivariicola]
MASTGSTHGMTLRISPPASAISSTQPNASPGAALPAAMAIWLSCAWPLSASTSDSVLPLRSGAASPQLSVTGTVAVNVSPRLVKLGVPKSISSMLSINSAGCCQPASRRAVTVSLPLT